MHVLECNMPTSTHQWISGSHLRRCGCCLVAESDQVSSSHAGCIGDSTHRDLTGDSTHRESVNTHNEENYVGIKAMS